MTRDAIRAEQDDATGPAPSLVRVTVVTTQGDTVTVTLPGGATVTAPRISGCTYVPGTIAYAIVQEPAVGPVLPIGYDATAVDPLSADVTSTTVTNTFMDLTFTSNRAEMVPAGYIAPRAGWYQARLYVRWADNTSSGRGFGINFTKNGSRFDGRTAWDGYTTPPPGGRFSQQTQLLIQCAAGDRIGATAFSDGGSTTLSSGALEVIPLKTP